MSTSSSKNFKGKPLTIVFNSLGHITICTCINQPIITDELYVCNTITARIQHI